VGRGTGEGRVGRPSVVFWSSHSWFGAVSKGTRENRLIDGWMKNE